MRYMNADRPKETIEEDRLGFAGFARALAQSICGVPASEGMVLAIHGQWGSGKTSAVNMTVEALGQLSGDEVVVVRFNPWWFSGQENLTRAFFAEIAAALESRVSSRVLDGLKNVARIASGSRDLVGALLSFAPGGGLLKGLGEAGLKALGDIAADNNSLDKVRSQLCDALRDEGRRILVIVDDVDRLPADEARQIFRLVKSVADLPCVVYLLVFDREIARRALGGSDDEAGPDWLEKIVQGSFDLPAAHPTDLQRLFTNQLDEIIAGTDVDLRRWPKVFHYAVRPWLRTARDTVRLANTIAVSWPPVKSETDFADFVAVETLRLFEPAVYRIIRLRSDLLCAGREGDKAERKAFAEGLVLAAPEARREDLKEGLQELFPVLQSAWSNWNYGGPDVEWDAAKRICSARRFPAYFTFAAGDDVLDEVQLTHVLGLLLQPDLFAQLVNESRGSVRRSGATRAALVLAELQRNAVRIPVPDRLRAIDTFLSAADRFINPTDEEGFFATPIVWGIWWTARAMLRLIPQRDRVRALMTAVTQTASLRIVVFLTSSVAAEHGLVEGIRATDEEDRLIDVPAVRRLQAAALKRIRAAARTGTLVGEPDLLRVLFEWARQGSEAEVRAFVARQLKTYEGALRIAEEAVGIAKVESGGIVTTRPSVDKATLGKLVDVDRLQRRLARLRKGAPDDDRVATAADRLHEGLKPRW